MVHTFAIHWTNIVFGRPSTRHRPLAEQPRSFFPERHLDFSTGLGLPLPFNKLDLPVNPFFFTLTPVDA